MCAVRFSLEVKNNELIDALNRLNRQFSSAGMRPVMKAIGERVRRSTRLRFDTSTAPDGNPWAGLSMITEKLRAKRIASGELPVSAAQMIPLVAQGHLKKSIGYRISDGGAGVEVGTNYLSGEIKKGGAAVHQFGSLDGKIPARPFLGLSQSDEQAIIKIIRRFTESAMRG